MVHLALVQYVFMLWVHVSAPGTTHGPHSLHRVFVAEATSPVVLHSLRTQLPRSAVVHTGAEVTHDSQPLHSPLERSAVVRHFVLVQWSFMLGMHRSAPGTTHGPHVLHRGWFKSPVVLQSR